jgi:hypothetical protein
MLKHGSKALLAAANAVVQPGRQRKSPATPGF